jgi:hypothetical protein
VVYHVLPAVGKVREYVREELPLPSGPLEEWLGRGEGSAACNLGHGLRRLLGPGFRKAKRLDGERLRGLEAERRRNRNMEIEKTERRQIKIMKF